MPLSVGEGGERGICILARGGLRAPPSGWVVGIWPILRPRWENSPRGVDYMADTIAMLDVP